MWIINNWVLHRDHTILVTINVLLQKSLYNSCDIYIFVDLYSPHFFMQTIISNDSHFTLWLP